MAAPLSFWRAAALPLWGIGIALLVSTHDGAIVSRLNPAVTGMILHDVAGAGEFHHRAPAVARVGGSPDQSTRLEPLEDLRKLGLI